MNQVDLAIRCDCGAALYGRVPRNRVGRLMHGFRATHSEECAAMAKRGKRQESETHREG